METVGFIGLGRMGSGMAGNIQKAGYPMVVYDVRPQAAQALVDKGARLAENPAELARLSDVIFTSVPGPKEVEAVVTGPNGILEGVKSGGIYSDLSTCAPSVLQRFEPMFRQKGAHVLDSPVLSSPTLVLTRELIVMVGGEREVFDRMRPIYDSISDQVIYAGSLGTGEAIKLVTNTMGMVISQVMAECLTLGVKAGAKLEHLLEVGRRAEVSGGFLAIFEPYYANTWFRNKFDEIVFTLALARKDVGECTEMARDVNVPMPVTTAAEQTMIEAMARGLGDLDWPVTMRIQEGRAGVEVRTP